MAGVCLMIDKVVNRELNHCGCLVVISYDSFHLGECTAHLQQVVEVLFAFPHPEIRCRVFHSCSLTPLVLANEEVDNTVSVP